MSTYVAALLKIISLRKTSSPRNLASASVFLWAFFGGEGRGASSRKSSWELRGILLQGEPPEQDDEHDDMPRTRSACFQQPRRIPLDGLRGSECGMAIGFQGSHR